MVDLRRAIILFMAAACVVTVIGVIHCHVNFSHSNYWTAYQTSYSIIFPILLSITGFLLLEQLLITDGTIPPLNRLRIIYAIGAAIALVIFGISSAISAHQLYVRYHGQVTYRNEVVAAVIAFLGAVVYGGEAVARNRKSRLI